MAKAIMPYQDLNHALKKFRVQVSESIPYAQNDLPRLDTPKQVFDYLKPRTRYKNDPKNRELFQMLPTLLGISGHKNRHGIPGAGDCDCFTIAALSTLLANGYTNCGIFLAGYNPFTAKHIWAAVEDGQGGKQHLDLTNKKFNQTRYYPFTQYIPYKINQNEKQMILELAENSLRPMPGPRAHTNHPYVFLPKSNVQVREDYFDHMRPGDYQRYLLSEGVDEITLEDLSNKRAARRAAKSGDYPRQTRAEKHAAKKAIKNAAKQTKPRNARKQSRIDNKRIRAEAKKIKAERGGGETVDSLFNKAGDLIGKFRGGQRSDDEQPQYMTPQSPGYTPAPTPFVPEPAPSYSPPAPAYTGPTPAYSGIDVPATVNPTPKNPDTDKVTFWNSSQEIFGVNVPKPVLLSVGALVLEEIFIGGIRKHLFKRR